MTIDLKDYDIALAIDKSGSMLESDCNGRSRWEEAQESTRAIAKKASEFDDDGIDVYPFSGNFKTYKQVTPDKVDQIFKENEPMGSTATDKVLDEIIKDYFKRKQSGSAKPMIILVITDGEPNDRESVKSVIINATKKMNTDEELGISFFQVGKDISAKQFLKELDDDLESKGAKFDIVDTKSFEELEEIPLSDAIMQAISD